MVCRRELAWTYGDGTLTSRRILGPWMWGWALTLMSLRDPHLPWGYFRGRGGGGRRRLVLQVLRIWLGWWWSSDSLTPQPLLPSPTCSRLWPQKFKDSWRRAC